MEWETGEQVRWEEEQVIVLTGRSRNSSNDRIRTAVKEQDTNLNNRSPCCNIQHFEKPSRKSFLVRYRTDSGQLVSIEKMFCFPQLAGFLLL